MPWFVPAQVTLLQVHLVSVPMVNRGPHTSHPFTASTATSASELCPFSSPEPLHEVS